MNDHTACRNYVDRHLETCGDRITADGENRAYKLIPWILKKGLNHDWDEEGDCFKLSKPTVEETAKLGLKGLLIPGVWSVCIVASLHKIAH